MKKSEGQNTEFKESWRDEFLKTLCAFANTQGGVLHVGIDDTGKTKGVKNTKKLLEDLPSKIKETLNVVAGVKVKKSNNLETIEVKITQSEAAVSYKGKYYVRSGSTTQELNGSDLQSFLLQKSNKAWELMPELNTSAKDIKVETIAFFKDKVKDKRPLASSEGNLEQLLINLHLKIKGNLLRAGILLFGLNPQKYYPGSFVKIGKFSNDEVLIDSIEIRGNLFDQAVAVMDALKTKYLSSSVHIEGLFRNVNLEYPESALREAIINAIAHKDYAGSHIQIKVYPDKLTFWNPGELPRDLTIQALRKKHPSRPRNERIAEMFHYTGLIESWGTGTMKMITECKNAGLPEPIFEEINGGISVVFSKDIYTQEYLDKNNVNERQVSAINYLKEHKDLTNAKYQELTKAPKRTVSRDLSELVEKAILERIGTTGKGTVYRLRGQSKRIENTSSVSTSDMSELDRKLALLDKELEQFDPDEEIKKQFSQGLFVEIFNGWYADLLLEVIPIIQKFNRYFIDPRHYFSLPNSLGGVHVIDQSAQEIVNELRKQLTENLARLQNFDAQSNFSTHYGSFRKAGFETFGANYSIEIKFEINWYEISMDDEVGKRTKTQQFKRQYHKPITRQEARSLAERFGDLIYGHINAMLSRIEQNKQTGHKGAKGAKT